MNIRLRDARLNGSFILMLQTPLEPGVRVGKEFINQDETRVLSPLLTTYIYFVASILHYVIDSCLPLTATSSPQVFLHLLRHYSVIERRRTVTISVDRNAECSCNLFEGPTVRVEKLQIVETRRILSILLLRRKLHSLTPQMSRPP